MSKLSKGSSAHLQELCGEAAPILVFGLSWKAEKPAGLIGRMFFGDDDVDLDAVALCFDTNGKLYDYVFPYLTSSAGNPIKSTGDDRMGAGSGDDEQLYVDLGKIDAPVAHIFLCAVIKSSHRFQQVEQVKVHAFCHGSEDDLVSAELQTGRISTACVVGALARDGDGWVLGHVGEFGNVETLEELAELSRKSLKQLRAA